MCEIFYIEKNECTLYLKLWKLSRHGYENQLFPFSLIRNTCTIRHFKRFSNKAGT